MAYYDGAARAVVFEAVITGTHSSGKTSVITSFRNEESELRFGITAPLGLSLQSLEVDSYDQENPEVLVPVITIAEGALSYAEEVGNPAVLGADYNMAHQDEVNLRQLRGSTTAKTQLPGIMRSLRSDPVIKDRLANVCLVLGDRNVHEGQVYSELRLTGEESRFGARFFEFLAQQATASLDVAFVADPAEVPFEVTDYRSPEAELRARVHTRTRELYRQLSHNGIQDLTGSVADRHQQIVDYLHFMLTNQFVARSPLTVALEQLRQDR